MTLGEKNQGFFAKHHKLLAAVLAIALPYAGFNGYRDVSKALAPPTGNVSVEIIQEAPTGPATIVNTGGSSGPSQIEIQVLIDKALATHQGSRQYHEFQR